MKRKARILVLILSLSMCLLLLPAAVYAADGDGDGYNDEDYTQFRAFLEQESSTPGVTNGEALSASYDPDDPATWAGLIWTDIAGLDYVQEIAGWDSVGLAGSLDVSGLQALNIIRCSHNDLTSLDASGCSALAYLYCSFNEITSLDISDCDALIDVACGINQISSLDTYGLASLYYLSCDYNQITSLDLRGCGALYDLDCENNQITSLTISGCDMLEYLHCAHNLLSSLDVSAFTGMSEIDCTNNTLTQIHAFLGGFDISVAASGNGYVGLLCEDSDYYAEASPIAPDTFINWTRSGVEVSTNTQYDIGFGIDHDLVAHFTGSSPSSPPPGGTGHSSSRDARLAALSTSAGPLSPAFDPSVTGYSQSVGSGVDSVTVTPTAADPREPTNITVNGAPVESGGTTDPIALNPGSNTITVIVNGRSGSKTYTVTVTRGEQNPKTGDYPDYGFWAAAAAGILLLMGIALYKRHKGMA